MRTARVVTVGLLATALLASLPEAAWAPCVIDELENVVERSDTVVVGTISGYEIRGGRILVELDVDETLKGSLAEGALISYQHCGPYMSPEFADELVGTRELFFLTEGPRSISMFGEVIEPQVPQSERIEMTRELLGIEAQTSDGIPGPPTDKGEFSLTPMLLLVAVAILMVGVTVLIRSTHGRRLLRRSGVRGPG